MSMEETRVLEDDNFPIGLRVLAVDDDPIFLKILEGLLRKCGYQVTTTSHAIMALNMLRENREMFDLIISDVYMPDMDGFKLLEHVGLEIDLPVIMLSAISDTKIVMKGISQGACDYLVKPVRMEELRNIWQHVFRRRKKIDSKSHNDSEENISENDDPSSQKKQRIFWSKKLHGKFIAAVNQLGIERATPTRILQLMNVKGLTPRNVSSHLQKYRLEGKRISRVASQKLGGNDSGRISSTLGIESAPTNQHSSLFQGVPSSSELGEVGNLNFLNDPQQADFNPLDDDIWTKW